MKKKTITLIGGSGFLAKYCISELLKEGHNLKIVCRNPHLAGHLRMMAPIEQLDIVKGNIMLKHTIEPYIKNSDVVINFVGVLNDSSGGQSFENCHSLGPKNIADLSAKYKVEKFIHFSSIGADIESDSKYQQSKGLGELNIQKSMRQNNYGAAIGGIRLMKDLVLDGEAKAKKFKHGRSTAYYG